MLRKANFAAIDKRLENWRQGDVVLDVDLPFLHLADYDNPITPEADAAASSDKTGDGDPLNPIFVNVPGFVIVTQTCDLVRKCAERPLAQLAILRRVDDREFLESAKCGDGTKFLDEVRRGERPRFAYIPSVANGYLIADLDAVMTVEKAVLAGIPDEKRQSGCRDEKEVREFAQSLARKVSRAAFPDDFVKAMRSVQERIRDKHGKMTLDGRGKPTNEGAFLTAISEIRVAGASLLSDENVQLKFYFIFNNRTDIPPDGDTIAEELLKRLKATGRFKNPSYQVLTISEMSAEAYLSSDPLELDYLSQVADDTE